MDELRKRSVEHYRRIDLLKMKKDAVWALK